MNVISRILFLSPLLVWIYSYPVPDISAVSFCFDHNCLKKSIQHANLQGSLIAGIVSFNFDEDGYLSTYLGWLMHILGDVKGSVHFVALQAVQPSSSEVAEFRSDDAVVYSSLFMLSILPPCSIFIAMEHGFSSFGMRNLNSAALQFGLQSVIIFHINHEQPWIVDAHTREKETNGIMYDFIFDKVEKLAASYSRFKLVFRNYYFDPLVASSIYVPVGVPMYSYIIGNRTEPAAIKLASQRRHFCLFTGRVLYSSTITHEHAGERQELWEMKNKIRECEFLTGTDELKDYHTHGYEDYIAAMADTIFSPCPVKQYLLNSFRNCL